MQHQKNDNERYPTRNGMWNLALWWTIASQRDFRRKLNQSLDPMLVSNIGLFAHLYHLTPISNPLRLYAILKLANSKNFRKVHSVLSNVTYCYKRSIFCISLCAKSGFQNLHRVFPIESTNTLLSSIGCSFHSVTCVVLNIKYHSLNDFTTHNVFFSSGAALLVLALFANYQIIPSTSAAPIDCQKNTAVCLEEIIKELTQVRFGIKILTENITLVGCKRYSFSNWTDYSILSLSLYCVAWKTVVLCMAISIPFLRNHFPVWITKFPTRLELLSSATLFSSCSDSEHWQPNNFKCSKLLLNSVICRVFPRWLFFKILVLWFDALFKNKRYIKNPSPVVFSPRQILRQMIGAHSYQTPCFRAFPQHQVSFILYSIAKNCAELYKSGRRISGVYTIDPDGSGAFDVYCDHTTAGGGWTVIQKRMDGSVDFNRTWNEYKQGYGRKSMYLLEQIERLKQGS